MSDDERKARFERALAHAGPTHTLADVAELVRTKKAQFWDNGCGMIVTEIHSFPLMKTLHYWLAAGELPAVLALQEEIDEWARGEGCEMATLSGRRGWGRAASAFGWRCSGYAYRKPLSSSRSDDHV